MKIAIAQTRSIKGDIKRNLVNHQQMIMDAVEFGASLIVFPELSLTNYEPDLAGKLATSASDPRLGVLQELSDFHQIGIGVGMPIAIGADLPNIGLIIFKPATPPLVYAKQYLHADEVPFFSPGNKQVYLQAGDEKIGLAICYELSVPQHAATVHENGATIYLVSEAKTVAGVEKAIQTLTTTSKQYGMTVLMSNCIGVCDNELCGGRSSIWDNKGNLLAQLDADHEGLLVYDTITHHIGKLVRE